MVLGWLLGSAANPVMKQRAEPGLDAILHAGSAFEGPSDEGWPTLAPGTPDASGGYRPDLDYDAVVGSEWAFPGASADADLAPPPSPADAFEAAGKAEQAAEDAAAAAMAAPGPDEPATEPQARKSALAQSGLY
jgi:hypothetical protein